MRMYNFFKIKSHMYIYFICFLMKAIEAAIHGRQWSKAVQIVETQDPSATEEYHKQIADHYASIKNYEVLYM